MSLEARAAHSRDQLQATQDNEPIDDIEQLRREVEKWRDEANELEDCRKSLRRLGRFCGCDHVESSDEREQQERHIEEAFMRLQDERDSFRKRTHDLEYGLTKLNELRSKLLSLADQFRREGWEGNWADKFDDLLKECVTPEHRVDRTKPPPGPPNPPRPEKWNEVA